MADDPELGEEARTTIHDAELAAVSAASAWEIAIKRALGKLDAPDDFARACLSSGFELMSIDFAHATAAGALPAIHSDPFDRMLVAQAQLEGLALVTRDARLGAYNVHVLPA